MESVNLNRLAYFAAVVDAGSFTRAADRLGITKAVVSQQIARLEAELKTALLHRTTRRVVPTESGRLLHARCTTILREAGDAVEELTQANVEPSGLLRVSATNDFGASIVAPLAAKFAHRHPGCSVDLVLSDGRLDPIEHQIDVTVRIGWLDDSSLQARRIGAFRQLLVATPSFAKAYRIQAPEDLSALPFLANKALKEPLVWQFTQSTGQTQSIRVRATMMANSTPAVFAAVLEGTGCTVLPDFLVDESVRSGRLVHLLPRWGLPTGGIHVVFPPQKFRPSKVNVFVSMLADEIGSRIKAPSASLGA